MSTPVSVTITDNAAAVISQVAGFPPRMAEAVAAAMDRENQLTIGHAQAKYLSGPRPLRLGVRSNRLRSSLNASKAAIEGKTVSSTIGTNVKYAGVHERGFDGNVTVRSHTMRVAALDLYSVKGRVVKGWELAGTGAKRARRVATGFATVRSFTRHMKMPARPYLAPAVADRAENYGASISAAILDAWQKGAV